MKKTKWIPILICSILLLSCAHMQKMSGKQKYLMARGTFNDAVSEYKTWALQQPEEIRAKLRKNNKLIKDAKKALDAWGVAYDDEDKAEAYANLSDVLFQIFVTYGIEIKEGP